MSMKKTVYTLETLLKRTIEEGDCLLWTGYHGNETPYVFHDGKLWPVRRLILALSGIEQKSTFAGCSCGNKSCVAPEHIVQRDKRNQAKVMAKQANTGATKILRIKKMTVTRREKHSKLDIETAREIRASSESAKEAASRVGISKAMVHRIRSGAAWRDGANPFAGLM